MLRRRLSSLLLRSPCSSAVASSCHHQQHHLLLPTHAEKPPAPNLLRLFTSLAGSDGDRPFIAFVLGGPGSGKGTQCSRIASDFGFSHVSAGDLLRNEISSGTDHGEWILEIIREGRIVPSEITVELVRKAIESSSAKRVLIDGFPRCEENRIAFEKIVSFLFGLHYWSRTFY
ncbi:unnamed protein product [Triticum turgidum subsp. durum]|uniref:adenylate kinase n=1 Tax=Triticum turgidum subsp. durum TaxID=4567 RepID=A0A9R1PBS7_TRITD|nr:unnamed protein product [Triticum turgidum subsp. durum]